MREILTSAVVAALVSLIAVRFAAVEEEVEVQGPNIDELAGQLAGHEVMVQSLGGSGISVAEEPDIAAWIRINSGEGADHKILSSAGNSVCFLTHVALGGIQSPEDSSACTVSVDDFTGFWQVTASVEEGTQAEVWCNARCIEWQ